jgi:hypothetical protein
MIFENIKNRSFTTEDEERKYFMHQLRIIDLLNLEEVFYFERNGVIFNFHNYYEEPQRMEMEILKK